MLRLSSIVSIALLASPLAAQEIFEVSALGIRPAGEDYAPVLVDSGFVMCSVREGSGAIGFTDEETNKPLSDLYWVSYKDGALGLPVLFSANLSTPVNEGPAAFTAAGATICYTRNQVLPKKLANLRSANGQLGLYFSHLSAGAWQTPIPFPHNSPKYSILHPTFSPDGKTLYFASDMPGGKGGMDLYSSQHNSEGWSEPRNLGEGVNSAFNEVYPRMHADSILYFSSDRTGGLGKLDIYYTELDGNDWHSPLALPAPVNSAANDLSFVVYHGGYRALFSSDREGSDRIYTAKRTVPKFRDCTAQQRNNYCYTFRREPQATTSKLPVDHVWDLGDSTQVRNDVAEHCYKQPGKYTVRSLLLDRKTGDTFQVLSSKELVIEDIEQAWIAAPDTVRTGRVMSMDGWKSNLSGLHASEYHWDMGDSIFKEGITALHAYRTPGTYVIKLDILTDPNSTGAIPNRCNTKQVVVIDRFHDDEDMAVVATYEDALGNTHTFEYQELPYDPTALESDSLTEVTFSVELFASKARVSLDDPRFAQVRKLYRVVERYDPERGIYTYSVGETGNMEELFAIYRKVKELQFMDAEVFALDVERLMDLSQLDMASLDELNHSKLRTNAIHFAYKSAALEDDSAPVLEQVVDLMRQHPEVQLVIEAHTDDIGSRGYNIDLSQQRARSVVDDLVQHGVDPIRLMPIGHGKNQPIASNKTEEGRSLNRRVEFRMTVKGEDQALQKTR
ncbi:MAG: OmpA family protein [Flavobacteriales bacterium]